MFAALLSLIPTSFGVVCDASTKFLGIFPSWYEYIGSNYTVIQSGNKFVPDTCGIVDTASNGDSLNHLLAIGLAVIDILLRVGGVVAVAFIIYGGFRYITSQGEPENTKAAQSTILNAVIGLVITILAATIVSFIGNSLK